MSQQKFNLISRITAFIVFLIATVTYLATIEPTTSFWDCGEFIASSYKLEVGHPPGNPVYQLIARFFTIFASPENAAAAVNITSALCSSFTILFLFLSIANLAKKLVLKTRTELSMGSIIAILGSATVGALAYCWSDTFWFSAVEAEVYAMSSLFTALVFWMMLKWEEQADEPYANRWIILISLLMGLSVGVHLLNLLCIPAITFIYYFKKYSNHSPAKIFGVLALSGVILAIILWGIIPYTPLMAAYFDLLFVNVFGTGFNIGAIFFMALVLGACFYGVYYTYAKNKHLLNTILLSLTMILIGYSTFAVIVIRSSANTPTNEYQPDNPFTLVRYLSREQYGNNPLIFGESYASTPIALTDKSYYTPMGDKYHKATAPDKYEYKPGDEMLFPRMWSNAAHHKSVYNMYSKGEGKRMPTMGENLAFFIDFQCNWMYWRYFMWNFAGRQNDLWSPTPGELLKGNWESGIGFLDKARLGDQSDGPDYLVNSSSKNHYYMLPLILGLIGLFFQLRRDNKNWFITMMLFILTGLAIVVYLNQNPMQVRERDYAYAGSFYVFSIWIGLAVLAVYDYLKKFGKTKTQKTILAGGVSALFLLVPVLMLSENWDDHDRSGRRTTRDLAYNYFMSTPENTILVTFADNDTFPLWYIQEVEEVRTDVRVMNTSLLGTDWYIDQMQNKVYESEPVELSIDRIQYLYGTNELPDVVERFNNQPILLKDMIKLFKDPRVKIEDYSGQASDYVPARNLILPVNVENVKKYGLVSEDSYDKILDTIVLRIPESRNYITKAELIILDMLSNYEWDRPIHFISDAGDLRIGVEDYLQYDGFTYRFVPIKSETSSLNIQQIDALDQYNKIMNVYKWDSFNKDIHIDYQNLTSFYNLSLRSIFTHTANALIQIGEKEKAVEVLDKMQEVVIDKNFPINASLVHSANEFTVLDAVDLYLQAGESEKGLELARQFTQQGLAHIRLSASRHRGAFLDSNLLDANFSYIQYLIETLMLRNEQEIAKELEKELQDTITLLSQ